MRFISPIALILIGVSLVIFMIGTESEPGAIPLILVMIGTGWFFIMLYRERSVHHK